MKTLLLSLFLILALNSYSQREQMVAPLQVDDQIIHVVGSKSEANNELRIQNFMPAPPYKQPLSVESKVRLKSELYEPWTKVKEFKANTDTVLEYPENCIVAIYNKEAKYMGAGVLIGMYFLLCPDYILGDETISYVKTLDNFYNISAYKPKTYVKNVTKIDSLYDGFTTLLVELERPLGSVFGSYGFGYSKNSLVDYPLEILDIHYNLDIVVNKGTLSEVSEGVGYVSDYYPEGFQFLIKGGSYVYGVAEIYDDANSNKYYEEGEMYGFLTYNDHSYHQILNQIISSHPVYPDLDMFSVIPINEEVAMGEYLNSLYVRIVNVSRKDIADTVKLHFRFESESGAGSFDEYRDIYCQLDSLRSRYYRFDSIPIPTSIPIGEYSVSCEILNSDYNLTNNKSTDYESGTVFIREGSHTLSRFSTSDTPKGNALSYNNGQLILNTNLNTPKQIIIYSVTGKQMAHFVINNNTSVFQAPMLNSGIYLYKVVCNNCEVSGKLLINK